MATLLFCTGNPEKLLNAQHACQRYGITLEQRQLDTDEIQSEDAELILQDKLQRAFERLQAPLIVSDDSWEIPALRGFPGPYMKSINHWLSPEDYLRLTLPLEDRTIYLVQRLGYIDDSDRQSFVAKTKGTLLKDIRGEYGGANHKLVALEGDNGLSISELYDQGLTTSERHASRIWHEFADWYVARQ